MDLRAIPDNERLLNLYRAYLTMQCGLADNTSLAYTEDVRKLLSYLDDESVPLADAGYPALENFLATLNDLGISLKSTSRIVSGVKSFSAICAWSVSSPTTLRCCSRNQG